MPFFYHLQISSESSPYKLVKVLTSPKDYLPAGSRLAILERGGNTFYLVSVKPGVFTDWLVLPGAVIDSSTKIATVAADGEHLPYGTYPLIEPVIG